MAPFLRKKMVFSFHNLATDKSFAEVHLIICRNVLIYFNRELQGEVIGLFEDSLIREGFLLLGTKENIDSTKHPHLKSFSKAERIFRSYA